MPPIYHFNANKIISEKGLQLETLNQFRQWCSEQKLPYLSEQQLIVFLKSSRNIEEVQIIIKKYFKCKSSSPELFTDLDISTDDLQEAITVYDIAVIPKRTPNNIVVTCGKLRNTSYSSFHLDKLFKLSCMALECCLYDGPVDGIIVVLDMTGIGVLHLTKIRLNVLQKFFQFIQEGIPCKIKAVHVLNTVNFIDKLLFILKPFIGSELYQAIKFHSNGFNSDEIFKGVPKSCLPKDYGGNLSTHRVLAQETYEKMLKLKRFYQDLEKQTECYKAINT